MDTQVNHPDYYKDDQGRECIEVMEERFGIQAVINFCKLNSFKYTWRAGRKPGASVVNDLAKAQWYEDKLLELQKKLQDEK